MIKRGKELLSYNELKKISEEEIERNSKKYIVRVANSTCAKLAGAQSVIKLLEEIEDSKVEIVKTGCMGNCYCEPTVEILFPSGEKMMFGNIDKRGTELISEVILKKMNLSEITEPLLNLKVLPKPHEIRNVLRNCGVIDPFNIYSTIEYGGYEALHKAITEYKPDEIIEIMKKSKLRGRGGAGYYTGKKWEIISHNQVSPKYVVCNADEGDPGAFMDRVILESDPHSVLESMAICGYAIGAKKGIIYVRIEYPLAVKTLEVAIEQAREKGVLGKNLFGTDFSFDIELKFGAGAFVCGEETALINSLEGKRGEPKSKPPYPSEKGYRGFPTVVNNVETFSNVKNIILRGESWFCQIGTEKSLGTKVFSLVGKIAKPSLIEIPLGTTLREIIYDVGGGIKNGKNFKAVQTGGPSGGALSENDLDIKIDYETLIEAGTMMGSGGMIIMDEENCMVNIAKFYLNFTRDESCGKCTPCRIGTKKLYSLVEKISLGDGDENSLELIEELATTIKRASLCGLGRTAPNPVLSTIKKFKEEYIEHISEKRCRSRVCKELLSYSVDEKNCIRCGACFRNCPVEAIKGDKSSGYKVDEKICIKCGVCYDSCKFNAIKVGGKI